MNDRELRSEDGRSAADGEPTLESAVAKLERLHIRLTPQRYAVLETIHRHSDRPSVETIVRTLAPRFPRLSATAVRNSVHVFEKMGLLPGRDGERGAPTQAG